METSKNGNGFFERKVVKKTHSKGLNPPWANFSFNVLLAHVPQKLGLFCLILACHVAFSSNVFSTAACFSPGFQRQPRGEQFRAFRHQT